ncbi:putative nonsense-mediated mRNA decay protein Upf3 [Aspergillus lucknowensis]|uniref:Smg-4/UPF3 family-domain-containing protein n=1 Tax=Aspergillus lucknowensis TaxID=176173 RepID=A0ABR4LXH6_9EURO
MTQILSKSAGGVLQIPASATQKSAPPPSKRPPKLATPRLKLVVRRLPPGLTQEEFETALGAEWKSGAGRVSWYLYKPGKVSKDPAKPSRPSRAYLNLISSDHISALSDKVRGASFSDALNTASDPVLLGPPSLEFAPYAKIPGSRVRKDARQGTIDQDPEFIQFLESLTQPVTKSAPIETTTEGEDKKEAVTTTPLVQYIKEKKANKAKEAANKSSRNRSERESKSDKALSKKLLQRPEKEASQPAGAEKTDKKSRADKVTKEAVKSASKQAANVASKQAAKLSAAQNSPKDTTQPATERKRERGNAAAVGKILQRDLGLAPSSNRRRGGRGTPGDGESKTDQAAASETSKKDTPAKSPGAGSAQDTKGKQSSALQSSETPSSQKSETNTPILAASTPSKPSKSGKGRQPSAPTPAASASTATQAFLKHANPSQGVTEPLLETAFAPFGKVSKVEIDKKKGFGYVDFAEPDGLQRAIAASPVTVAQSQVVVLERKLNPSAEKGRGKARGEAKPPTTATDGSKTGNGKPAEGGSGGNTSSRSRRSARGNRGGPKGNGGGSNANSSEQKPAETK